MHRLTLTTLMLANFGSMIPGIVYVRIKNERGPAAVQAGLSCLELLTNTFFFATDSVQIQNIVVFHLQHLSSPSREIEIGFLQSHHAQYTEKGHRGDHQFQLKVMSDKQPLSKIRNIQFIDHKLIDFYVIVIDGYGKLERAMRYVSASYSFNPRGKYVILHNNPDERDQDDQYALQVLNFMFINHHSVNVLVAFAIDLMTYNVYTGDPYHGEENDCGQMKTLKVATIVNGTYKNKVLAETMIQMPKVPPQMEHCTFQFCTRVASPFIDYGCQSGLEIEIMQLLQESMKFKVNVSCSTMERGELLEDGIHWSDLLGMVRDDFCDIIAGSFYPDYDVHMDFAGTTLYFLDYYTWFVRKAGLANHWKVLLSIFELATWKLLAAVLLVSSVAWFFIGYNLPEANAHKQLAICFLNTWCVFLGISSNNRPCRNSLRFFFITLAIYGMNVTTIYTSKLIYAFTSPPRSYQIDTVSEILDSNVLLGGRMEYEDWFRQGDKEDLRVSARYDNSEPFQPSPANLRAVAEGQRVILMSRMYVLHSHYRNDIHGLTKDVFANQVEMIVEKGFPLLPKFNRIISNLNDMGITGKLFEDFVYNVTFLDRIRETLHPDEDHYEEVESEIVLTLEHLQSAFFTYVLGIGISGFIFLVELIAITEQIKRVTGYVGNMFDNIMIWLKLREPRARTMKIRKRLRTKTVRRTKIFY
ncbi:uncharacterized protein LOC131688823 [Topomyia yanbarensis]|uniref:uncharacterized protein LOC131688823 n=1 Tax=Topomyia yanbarensis TaxID=2498891 RepID=UPI00273B2421|nr:uncharacterized protein LOC131688823 [Topomyia yanbarensis]